MEEKLISEVARKIRTQLERQVETQSENPNQAVRLMEMCSFIKTQYSIKSEIVF